jgi:DNA-binding CsgD family transcriptional regulator
MNDGLKHYGTPRHSGRYPWGSGEDPQRNRSFLQEVADLRKKGISDTDIARGMGMTSTQFRARNSIANAEQRKSDYTQAMRMKDKGMSNVAIGKVMGKNESSIRSLLDEGLKERAEATNGIANMLKDSVDKKGYIDVGTGVERYMEVSRTKLKTAIEQLKGEGYLVTYVPVEQLGTGKKTSVMVLSKPSNEAIDVVRLKNKNYTDDQIAKELGMKESDVTSLLKQSYHEVYTNKDNIKMITDHSEDGGRSFLGLEPVNSISSKRVQIRYDEDGGSDRDGVIELRRGVDDLSLGKAKYAQVRIGVDDTHYMKGMAMYNDNMPKGIDVIYNTNKKRGTPPTEVFKGMKKDIDGNIITDNPFGASVKQQHYITEKGKNTPGSDEMLNMKRSGVSYADIAKKMKVSEDLVKDCIKIKAVNIINEEGEWRDKWSKSLSSQMLSKQTTALAKKQLGLAYDIKKEEFDEIMALNNPAVKKKLLESFSDDCDSAAVHLKAAALPRSGWHALLPFPDMKENEVFAPNFRDGEKIVLIRYPHGGIFEIPELTVNNKHAGAKAVMEGAKDAIGIHPKVAVKLSGADFDGDAVLAIPNNNRDIKHRDTLKSLKEFDPKINYKPYDGMRTIDGGIWNEKERKVIFEEGQKPISRTKQMKMGDVSNLITDMTIRGANWDEIAAAVRHSMVVIDSEKHHLDYKQSYIDNGIASLKKKYQGSEKKGASTLISKASSEARPGVRKETIDPKTGKKIYEYTGETYTKIIKKADGTIMEVQLPRTTKSTKMAEVDDAFTLSSGTPMESVYASHANRLKSLANQARKEYINTPPLHYSPEAKKKYSQEVNSLMADLNIALKNAPLERQAQIFANTTVSIQRQANPNMDAADIKKLKGQALAEARTRMNSKKQRIDITDKKWEAIQAGAISNNTLMKILNNTDIDRIKQLATPRTTITITPAKKVKAETMLASGYTQAQVADAIGVSVATLAKVLD